MRCENINLTYGKHRVLKNISLTLKSNVISVIKGPSGCGKTSLLRCLAFIEKADSGKVFMEFDGVEEEVRYKKNLSFYPKVSIVFQQLFLWPHLTCRENIFLVSKNQPFTEHLIQYFRIEPLLDRRPNQISIGQKQRVAIIRALSFDSDILLLDEITSALDSTNRALVAELLNEMSYNQKKIMCITHDSDLIKMLKCEEYIMENGEFM